MGQGVQTQVNVSQAPAVAGDWASGNPRTFYTAGPGGLVAGASGVTVGLFAWVNWSNLSDPDAAPIIASNSFSGVPIGAFGFGGAGGASPSGFIHRQQQGLNTTYLLDASMTVPSGFPVALCTGGDVWVKNDGSGAAYPGYAAYADFATGKVSFAAAGTAVASGTAATSAVAAATSIAATGGIANNLMTISAISTGKIVNGSKITVGAATGTYVVSQVTPLLAGEATGGIGRYFVSIPEQSVAAGTSFTMTSGVLTLGATPSVPFKVGALITGSGVDTGTYITQLLTGTGAASGDTFAVSSATVVSSTTITSTTNVATKWFAQSGGAAGELIKMTSWSLG